MHDSCIAIGLTFDSRNVYDARMGNVTDCMVHSMLGRLITQAEVIDIVETVSPRLHQIYRI